MAQETTTSQAETPKRTNFISNKQAPRATPLTNRRIYRSAGGKWVTREIASLDFLSSIPLVSAVVYHNPKLAHVACLFVS